MFFFHWDVMDFQTWLGNPIYKYGTFEVGKITHGDYIPKKELLHHVASPNFRWREKCYLCRTVELANVWWIFHRPTMATSSWRGPGLGVSQNSWWTPGCPFFPRENQGFKQKTVAATCVGHFPSIRKHITDFGLRFGHVPGWLDALDAWSPFHVKRKHLLFFLQTTAVRKLGMSPFFWGRIPLIWTHHSISKQTYHFIIYDHDTILESVYIHTFIYIYTHIIISSYKTQGSNCLLTK